MNERTTLQTDLNVFADFNPKLPPAYRTHPYLLLGNIQPSLQDSVRRQMNGARLTAGDTMNLWIQNSRAELLETIRHWDVLLINDSEARMLSEESNLLKAARVIRGMGPRILVIKRGEYGAMLFGDDYLFSVPGYLLDEVVDPTGAGDSFAGGFMGYLASRGWYASSPAPELKELARAMVYGSVMGSFCCEQFGVARLRSLTRAEIDGRYRQFQDLTSF
jgi:sugar/nucleoside kinase (ribokinase family)